MTPIRSISVSGYRSIRDLPRFDLGPLNLFIGANGSGKSNLVSFFSLLNAIGNGDLQRFVGTAGGADALLHYGSRAAQSVRTEVACRIADDLVTYVATLTCAAPDTLIFGEEAVQVCRSDGSHPELLLMGSGHKETAFEHGPDTRERHVLSLRGTLRSCRAYHFHDTVPNARVRLRGYVHDNTHLRVDAANLAAYLYGLLQTHPAYYRRIVETVRMAFPQFRDFDLRLDAVNPQNILLNWREENDEYLFGPHQLSDGTLRFMCLATLFLQPEDRIPDVLILDEPELGLHPGAIHLLGEMFRRASVNRQLLIATQCPQLVDVCRPEEVVVVERVKTPTENTPATTPGYESLFRRLSQRELEGWLEDYSLGQLWMKNAFAGRL